MSRALTWIPFILAGIAVVIGVVLLNSQPTYVTYTASHEEVPVVTFSPSIQWSVISGQSAVVIGCILAAGWGGFLIGRKGRRTSV